MAFRDFKYPDVLGAFGLTATPAADLFAGVPPVPPSPALVENLAVGSRHATTVNTEKARSEGMIAPLLTAFWWTYHGRIGLYSGNEFDGDAAAGLNGYCDFILSRAPQQPFVTPPAVVIVEAKRENINDGLGQCVAGMIGAVRFNARGGMPINPIYGCVTTGSVWRFVRLNGAVITLGLREYGISEVDRLLGIFVSIVGPPPAVAA